MREDFKVYRTTNTYDEHDTAKDSFVNLFTMLFFSDLERDEDLKRVGEISEKLNTKSKEFVVNALQSAMGIQLIATTVDGVYNGIIKIKRNKITDALASGVDSYVMAEARKKAHHNNHLKLINELGNLSGDLQWSFNFRAEDSTVSFVKPVNVHRQDVNKKLCHYVQNNLNKLESVKASQKERDYVEAR